MGAVFSSPCRRRRRAAPVVISHPKPLSRSASGMSYMSSRPGSIYHSRRRSKGSSPRPTSQVSVVFDESPTSSANTSSASMSPRHSKDSCNTLATVSDIDRELGSQEQLSEKETQQALRKSASANSLASSLVSQRANRSTLPDVPEETAQVDAQLAVTEDVTASPSAETHARAASHSFVPSSANSNSTAVSVPHSPITYHRVGSFRKRARSTRPPTASAYTHTSIHSLIDTPPPPTTQSEQAQSGWRQFAAQQKASRHTHTRSHSSSHPYAQESAHAHISPPSKLREVSNLARKRTRERASHLRKVRRVEGYDWIRPEDLEGFESADGASISTARSTPTPSLELTYSPSFQTTMTSTLCV